MKNISNLKTGNFLIALLCFTILSNYNLYSQSFGPEIQLDPISTGDQELEGRKMIQTVGDSVYVIYQHTYNISGNYYSDIYFKKSTDNGNNFSAPVHVGNIAGAFQYGPSMCVDNSGKIYVSWTQFTSQTTTNLYFTKSDNGGASFNNSTFIAANSFVSDIAVYNNNVYIMYMYTNDGICADYFITRSADGGNNFMPGVKINDEACNSSIPFEAMLSMDIDKNNGAIHAVWIDGRNTNSNGDIYYTKSVDNGATFSSNIAINDLNSPFATQKHFYPVVRVGNDGRAYVVWQETKLVNGNPTFHRIMFTRENMQGGSFENEMIITDTLSNLFAYHPYIDISDNGLVAITYTSGGLWITTSEDGGVSFPDKTKVTDGFAVDPRLSNISIDENENLHILYRDVKTGRGQVYYTKGNITPTDGLAFSGEFANLNCIGSQGSIQWQISSDGETYSDISGATTNLYNHAVNISPTGKWFFRAKLTNPACISLPVSYSTVSSVSVITSTANVNVGDFFHGGRVFYTDGSGNGWIAPVSDQTDSVTWGCSNNISGAISLTDGQSNTNAILSGCLTRPIAASICDSSTFAGADDWYLPAVKQLDSLVAHNSLFTGYSDKYYWSSTQSGMITDAYTSSFNQPGMSISANKTSYRSLRCIRTFTAGDPIIPVMINVFATEQPVPVSIVSQQSVVNVCSGGNTEIGFDVSGTSLSYQWKRNGTALNGETGATLIIDNADLADEDTYTCVITNTCNSAITTNISLQVIDLNLDAGSDTSVCSGYPATLHAVTSSNHTSVSGTVDYLWSPATGLSNPMSATTNASATSNTTYTVTATDDFGCVQSDHVTLSVGNVYQYDSICIVTVDTLVWKNKVKWIKTYGKGTEKYKIFKETSTNVYTLQGEVNFNDTPEFIDVNSVPESHSDRYKIAVVDTCGTESNMSVYHNTMNLVISVFGSTMGLVWTPYQTEDNSYIPDQYYIYKGPTQQSMQLLTTVTGSQNTYNDLNVFDLNYYMIAVDRNCNPFKAYSNTRDNGLTGYAFSNLSGTILISPNPMSTSATLTIPNFKSKALNSISESSSCFELRISDLTGKVVRVENITPSSILQSFDGLRTQDDSGVVVIERGNLKPGIYFVELNAERSYKGKLIVE